MIRTLLVAAALLIGPGAAVAQGAAAPATAAPTAAKPAPCNDEAHGQFDFWVGRWSVTGTGKKAVVAHSLIEKVYGCGIRENWMPLNGQNGGSLSMYVRRDKGWRQSWIDSSGTWVDFKGGWNGSAMVLTGDWPTGPTTSAVTRMTYTRNADGSVRQLGETTSDSGKTWTSSFDFTYRREAP